jgi:hypothetical protein
MTSKFHFFLACAALAATMQDLDKAGASSGHKVVGGPSYSAPLTAAERRVQSHVLPSPQYLDFDYRGLLGREWVRSLMRIADHAQPQGPISEGSVRARVQAVFRREPTDVARAIMSDLRIEGEQGSALDLLHDLMPASIPAIEQRISELAPFTRTRVLSILAGEPSRENDPVLAKKVSGWLVTQFGKGTKQDQKIILLCFDYLRAFPPCDSLEISSRSSSAAVRADTSYALVKLDRGSCFPIAVRLAKDPSPLVQVPAIYALGMSPVSGEKRIALSALIRRFARARAPGVRASALIAAIRQRFSWRTAEGRRLLADHTRAVRVSAWEAAHS